MIKQRGGEVAFGGVRQDSDYDDFFVISKAEVVEQIDNATFFVAEIKKFLDTK